MRSPIKGRRRTTDARPLTPAEINMVRAELSRAIANGDVQVSDPRELIATPCSKRRYRRRSTSSAIPTTLW